VESVTMRIQDVVPVVPQGGLWALDKVALSVGNQQLLDWCAARCGGSRSWRHRKWAEARDLLALSQIAPRFKVREMDLRETFRALALLRVPVPCTPDAHGQLRVERLALLGITYVEEAVYEPQPGYGFVTVLEPSGVWHPNVATHPAQAVCLGPKLPAGILVKELVLSTYGALSMQSVQMDERAAEGVLNAEAALWWQQRMDLVPLSRTPFLSPGD